MTAGDGQVGPVEPARLEAVMRELTEAIGVRLAGTPADAAAAAAVGAALRESGAGVRTESFPVRARVVAAERLEIRTGGRWKAFPASLFSNTPGTGGQPAEAPLVFFESPAEYRRPDLSHLRGKAVVHLGCHIESREAYRRLMEAKPAFLLFVDVRFPGGTPLADGMFPAYTEALGAVPVMNVAYRDAWNWQREGASAARLCVAGGMEEAQSENVIAELPGSDPDAGVLVLGAHHDTQAGSPGADDNASGVAGLVELARVLAPVPRLRTIRLISFGAEEQLSVGSAAYVRRHRDEIARSVRLIFNLDSIGSGLGWTEIWCNGPDELDGVVAGWFERGGLYPSIKHGIIPYSDHFPFVAAGVPGVWMWRPNCSNGRFFHHRPDDDMSRVSPARMAAHLDALAAGMAELAQAATLPFSRAMPEDRKAQADLLWQDLFGGW
jgi:hypothetical protein